MISDSVKSVGDITAMIEYKNKTINTYYFPNIILNKGRESLANFLVNQKEYVFIQNMLFGDGGVEKTVNADRNSLFGVTRVNKPVIAQIDPLAKAQAIFTVVIDYEEANGYQLNEMALQLNNENFFSMATFPDFGKTDQMRITFLWRITF